MSIQDVVSRVFLGLGVLFLSGCAVCDLRETGECVQLLNWDRQKGYVVVGEVHHAGGIAAVREWLRANPPFPENQAGAVIPPYVLQLFSWHRRAFQPTERIPLHRATSRYGADHYSNTQLQALRSIFELAPPTDAPASGPDVEH